MAGTSPAMTARVRHAFTKSTVGQTWLVGFRSGITTGASGHAGHHGIRARCRRCCGPVLSFFQSLAMNFFVCSGIAQLVALEIWPSVLTWGAVVTVALLAAVIGARLFLMSVAM